MEQELAVAFHAEDGRVDDGKGVASAGADGVLHAVDGELVRGGVADDAALADVLAAGLKLRLHEDDRVALPGLSRRREGGDDGGDDEARANEADVHGEEGDGFSAGRVKQIPFGNDRKKSKSTGLQQAGVRAFHQRDSRVGAELVVYLAIAGVHGEDGGCAVLQHAVGKAARGGADVRAGETFDRDGPDFERGLQLETSAGDVSEVVAQHADRCGIVHGRTGLGDLLLIDEDATGQDQRLRPLTRCGQIAVNQQFVESHFHRSVQDSGLGETRVPGLTYTGRSGRLDES